MISKTKFDGYSADGRRLYRKGGGSKAAETPQELKDLYAEQAQSARMLRQQAESNLPGAVNSYVGRVNDVLDPNYAEKQAGLAAADLNSAAAMQRAATNRDLVSQGVNPNDPRFAGSLRALDLSNAAQVAAGKNATRKDALGYQLNVAKDAVGTFTGASNNAAVQSGNVASGLGSLHATQVSQRMAADAAQQNAVGSAVGGAMAAYSLTKKDGGPVCPPKKVQHLAMGGLASLDRNQGFFQMQPVAPPPVAQAPQQAANPVGAAIGTATQVSNLGKLGSKAPATGATPAASTAGTSGAAQGVAGATTNAAFADTAATGVTGAAAGTAAGTEAAAAGGAAAAEAAGTTAATTAATSATGATAATAGLMSTVGAAIPWIGAAYAVGSLLEWWSDGGEVGTQRDSEDPDDAQEAVSGEEPAGKEDDEAPAAEEQGSPGLQDLRPGGTVPGKWTENKDTVPALLVESEYVLNAEATKLVGADALNKINQEGLKLRKKGQTPDTIKSVGLEALA